MAVGKAYLVLVVECYKRSVPPENVMKIVVTESWDGKNPQIRMWGAGENCRVEMGHSS